MSEHTKIFEYQENGLSYTVTVYERDGQFFADIVVNEGAMDVNAIYLGDDDMSGLSVSLKGPLNMNGDGSLYEGETVQWDQAIKLSDPGLGRDGTDKDTYVAEGETLTVSLPISSLDDIDFFGIRATSTTTDEGSIKGVSGDPEEPEEPDDLFHDKVFFDYGVDESGQPLGGFFITAEEPENNEFNVPALPEGTEPTFENYLAYFEEIGGEIDRVASVVFYEVDDEGIPQETFRIDAPEGGFADGDAALDAYNAAIEAMEADDAEALDLMSAVTFDFDPEDELLPEDEDEPEELLIF